ncbi:MAG: U32 family peptidase [Clostridiales bacterium]|nr:U32 family peptidase [Clostridiales bacterium]
MNKRPELLAPAGNLEKLKVALAYGADAVYMSGKQFGLRAFAGNFDNDEIAEAVDYAHSMGKKVYITMNIFAHNDDFLGMKEYMRFLSDIQVDAVILSDPGILSIARQIMPNVPIHLSTQANNTNWHSANFWHEQGVKRIILARELSLEEIIEIRRNTPETLELEAFVHGAMCISYSGRCLLSNVFTGRDANRGQCAHPCRWKYSIVEEKRPGEYHPVFEDERGTYIMNSKDICMLEHIPQLMNAGIDGFKIEGRMKSSYYVATVIQAYRKEIDTYFADPDNYIWNAAALDELKKASHRPFTTGFYFGKPSEKDHQYMDSHYIRSYDFVGMVMGYDSQDGLLEVEQRNSFGVGDSIEIMIPGEEYIEYKVETLLNEDKQPISKAPHPQQKIYLPLDRKLNKFSILRKIRE